MEITYGAAIIAGVIGTAAMTVLMYMGGLMGMKMDMPMMLGTMFLPKGAAARVLGLGLHFMMGIGFFLVYAAILDAAGIHSNIAGWTALFGAVHALLAGMAMGMMPAMHPRMRTGRSLGASQATLPAPGFFGLRMGLMAPMAIIALHVVYGAVGGAAYSGLQDGEPSPGAPVATTESEQELEQNNVYWTQLTSLMTPVDLPSMSDHRAFMLPSGVVLALHFDNLDLTEAKNLNWVALGMPGVFCRSDQERIESTYGPGFTHFHDLENDIHGGAPGAKGVWFVHTAVRDFQAPWGPVSQGVDLKFMPTPPPDCR